MSLMQVMRGSARPWRRFQSDGFSEPDRQVMLRARIPNTTSAVPAQAGIHMPQCRSGSAPSTGRGYFKTIDFRRYGPRLRGDAAEVAAFRLRRRAGHHGLPEHRTEASKRQRERMPIGRDPAPSPRGHRGHRLPLQRWVAPVLGSSLNSARRRPSRSLASQTRSSNSSSVMAPIANASSCAATAEAGLASA